MAVSRDLKKLVGVSVIEQNETPGFGAKIAAPPVTRTWFGGRDPDADEKFIPPFQEGYYGLSVVTIEKHKDVSALAAESAVDAISGATITSQGLLNAVKAGVADIKRLVPGR